MNETLDIRRKPKKEVEQMLEKATPSYPKYEKTRGLSMEEAEDMEDEDAPEPVVAAKGSYNYLLNLPVSSFTQEKLDRLKAESDKYQSICDVLEKQTEVDLWTADIDAFSTEYVADTDAWNVRNSLAVTEAESKLKPKAKTTFKAKAKGTLKK
jgi:DNA topoisomerase-2